MRETSQIDNISAGHIETTLDVLIAPALTSINETTGLAREAIASLIVLATRDSRQQPARRDGFSEAALRYMLVGSSEALLAIKLNHNHAVDLCTKFLEHTIDVDRALHHCLVGNGEPLASIGLELSATKYGHLFTARQTVSMALKEFLEFRKLIADKFERLASQEAKRYSVDSVGLSYSTAFSQARMGVITAINRYSSTRGALASYVSLWITQHLKDADNMHEGVAYDVDSSVSSRGDGSLAAARGVPLDDVLLETLAGEEFVPIDQSHTRALSRLKHLRPAMRATGGSLLYPMSRDEQAKMIRLAK